MLDYKTDLFILKERDYNDLDRIITVFTKDFGKKTIKLRSAYKPLSKLNSHIQFFSIINCDIISGKSFDYICNATKEVFYEKTSLSLKKNNVYYLILEILDKVTEEGIKDVEVYNLCIRYFEYLEKFQVENNDMYIIFEEDEALIDSLYKFLMMFFKLNGFGINDKYKKDNVIKSKENFFGFIYFYVERYLKMEKMFR